MSKSMQLSLMNSPKKEVRKVLTIDCSPNYTFSNQLKTKSTSLNLKKSKSKSKKRSNKINEKEKREKMFNKIYGVTQGHIDLLNRIRRNKKLTLQEHQNKLLQISTNLRKENILKLNREFRNIRIETSTVLPLSPLNYKSLVQHSKIETQKGTEKKIRITLQKSLMNSTHKTAYELELEKERIRYFKPLKLNPNIARLYEILPEHIVKAFAKQK